MRRDPGPVRPEAVEAVDAAWAEGPACSVAVVAAETEAEEVTDALDAAFGPVDRWWVGPVGRHGVMRLPLP